MDSTYPQLYLRRAGAFGEPGKQVEGGNPPAHARVGRIAATTAHLATLTAQYTAMPQECGALEHERINMLARRALGTRIHDLQRYLRLLQEAHLVLSAAGE